MEKESKKPESYSEETAKDLGLKEFLAVKDEGKNLEGREEELSPEDEILLSKLKERIHNEFPEINYSQARLVKEGLDNVIVILDEKIVFRFPWTERYIQSFSQEVQLLDKIKDKVPLPIPDYKYVSAKRDFGGYEMIQGNDLTPELFETLPEYTKKRIAKQLGEFLSALHVLPTDLVKNNQPGRNPTVFRKRYVEKRRPILASGLTPDLLNRIDEFYENFARLNAPDNGFIHGDMYGRHFLLALNKKEISGVLDFGEACVGDRASDFFAFNKYGNDFLNQVLKNYTLKEDESFVNRSQYYFVRSLIDDLYRKIEKGGDTTELVSAIEAQLVRLKYE